MATRERLDRQPRYVKPIRSMGSFTSYGTVDSPADLNYVALKYPNVSLTKNDGQVHYTSTINENKIYRVEGQAITDGQGTVEKFYLMVSGNYQKVTAGEPIYLGITVEPILLVDGVEDGDGYSRILNRILTNTNFWQVDTSSEPTIPYLNGDVLFNGKLLAADPENEDWYAESTSDSSMNLRTFIQGETGVTQMILEVCTEISDKPDVPSRTVVYGEVDESLENEDFVIVIGFNYEDLITESFPTQEDNSQK